VSSSEIAAVPFSDFRSASEELRCELDAVYARFIDSGRYVLGDEVAAFENEYASYCEADQCVGVGSGLDALLLAIKALGVSRDDEVIVASNTYIATWLAVTHAGANPVPVEPNERTFNLDPACVEPAITPKTKAILATNLYGQPCDYDALLEIARRRGLKLVIDNAQAHGALYKGKKTGGIADIECHSFYPSKNLGAFGEAGAITTSDADVAEKVRTLRNYGSKIRYYNEMIGFNSRLDELQAGFLRVKLKHLDKWNARRASVAEIYLSALAAYQSNLALPSIPEFASPVWHLFVVRHEERDSLQRHLQKCGVQTLIHYPVPPHMSAAYRCGLPYSFKQCSLPIAERLASQVLSLPMSPHTSAHQATLVAEAVAEFCRSR